MPPFLDDQTNTTTRGDFEPVRHSIAEKLASLRASRPAVATLLLPQFYETARKALAQAHRVDEVKDIRDKAEALQRYARQAKDTQLMEHATEIRMRAEIRAGELLQRNPKNRGTRGTAQGRNASGGIERRPPEDTTPTLAQLNISKTQSSRWQRLAALPTQQQELKIAQAKHKAEAAIVGNKVHRARADDTTDEWYTPIHPCIDAVKEVLGSIDLDPATIAFAQARIRAARFFTKEDDGLVQQWSGRVFLNAPFSKIKKFVDKLVSEVQHKHVTAAIMVTHAFTDTAWWHQAAHAATAICFTSGRVQFEQDNGPDKKSGPQLGQSFFYFGKDVTKFRTVFERIGIVLVP
jgi:phage N-6-adenine-methyltransferase